MKPDLLPEAEEMNPLTDELVSYLSYTGSCYAFLQIKILFTHFKIKHDLLTV